MSKKRKVNVMVHHVIYAFNGVGKHEQIEIKVPIYTTEHHILTELQRRGKNVSKGFLSSLRYFIWERDTTGNFVDLPMPDLPAKIVNTIEKTQEGATNDTADCDPKQYQ